MKSTGIICTIGPASQSTKVLQEMAKGGMNIARLNFSHGNHQGHLKNLKKVRRLGKVKAMQDLQGLKIRVDNLAKPVTVKVGQVIVIGKDFDLDCDISAFVKPGERLFIEDGLLEFLITKVKPGRIFCKSINGGEVKARKGINLPKSKIPLSGMTKKDIADLKFGLKCGFDFIALSFVRSKQDIEDAKQLVSQFLPPKQRAPKLIAKIEKPEAVKNIDEIIKSADLVMIARGDLGVETSQARVPLLQKQIVKKCLKANKPVIVATQMLDSMVKNPRPTRAEVSDVANAVLDGASYCMLSAETAMGHYPVLAVKQMKEIIKVTHHS